MLVAKKFVVSSDLQVVESLRREGFSIVMVDGNIDGFVPNYGDFVFDHHRQGGGLVQITDILDNRKQNGYGVFRMMLGDVSPERLCFITPMLDADAIMATSFLLMTDEQQNESKDLMIAISYDCDHLFVPKEYENYSTFASNVVAGFKYLSDNIIEEMGYPLDRRSWSKQDKEKITGEIYSRAVNNVIDGIFPQDPDYFENKVVNVSNSISNDRISVKKDDVVIFDCRGLDMGYIDPRVWYYKLEALDLPYRVIKSLTVRDLIIGGEKLPNLSYTLGVVPLTDHQVVNYSTDTYDRLNQKEKLVNPEASSWGGRATVGGCPRGGSMLTIDEVVDCM